MKVDRNIPLFPIDTENQTYGCRHTNPDICKDYDLVTTCAFVCEDKICKKPPNGWKKQYQLLSKK